MKKSKEQVIKELGVDQPGYWFARDESHNTRFYWGLDENVKRLLSSFGYTKIHAWRRSQTDWRSLANLTIYDRYGSKVSWNENLEMDMKLTDAGQEHWKLHSKAEWMNYITYREPKIYLWMGGTQTIMEIKDKISNINRLYPVKDK
jgi:hypothetical protein